MQSCFTKPYSRNPTWPHMGQTRNAECYWGSMSPLSPSLAIASISLRLLGSSLSAVSSLLSPLLRPQGQWKMAAHDFHVHLLIAAAKFKALSLS